MCREGKRNDRFVKVFVNVYVCMVDLYVLYMCIVCFVCMFVHVCMYLYVFCILCMCFVCMCVLYNRFVVDMCMSSLPRTLLLPNLSSKYPYFSSISFAHAVFAVFLQPLSLVIVSYLLSIYLYLFHGGV